jgi:hypothetical protein
MMTFQTNAFGTFQEGHWFIWHTYVTTILSGCRIPIVLEGSQHDNLTNAN